MYCRLKYIFIFIFIFSILLCAQSGGKSRRRADKFIFNNKSRTVTYIGNTKMEDDDSFIKSDKMVFYIDSEIGDFRGRVSMLDKKNDVIIYSSIINYNGIKKFADAKIKPKLVSVSNNLTIRSVVMERDFNTPFAIAKDDVHLVHINEDDTKTDGYADLLEYNLDNKIAYLIGNPKIIQEDDILEGEIIEYNTDTGIVNVMGRGTAYVVPRSSEDDTNSTSSKKKKSTKVINDSTSKFTNYNIIKADRFEFETESEINDNRMIYAYGNVSVYYPEENMILSGQELAYNIDSNHATLRHNPVAKIPKQKTIVFSDWLEYQTDGDYKDIIFHNNVLMFDYQEDMSMEGQSIVIDPDTKVATSKGEPITYLEDRKVRIKATTFQRFDSHEKLRANGDVVIDQKNINAESDWALYYDKIKQIKLLGGNPIIIQNGNAIRAREIIYHIDTGEVESTRVSGVLE